MKGVRGASKQPGEVRRSQNWVGGTRPSNAAYVPPPPEEVPRLLGELERLRSCAPVHEPRGGDPCPRRASAKRVHLRGRERAVDRLEVVVLVLAHAE
jgi:hypothetical protein